MNTTAESFEQGFLKAFGFFLQINNNPSQSRGLNIPLQTFPQVFNFTSVVQYGENIHEPKPRLHFEILFMGHLRKASIHI